MVSRFSTLACTAILLVQSASAHMIMASPVPYSIDKLDNSPLASGDFPCKQKIGFTVSTMNTMTVGESQTLSFKGTAVHGGGSCQLAVTLDKEPTATSTFKVIKSMEGACPGVDGGASTFDFKIPSEIPSGEATFAWTWFSKLSGAPEMYMNCAPITVEGGASDSTGFDALPDMFVANIPEASCTSPQNFDTKFPSPGSEVQIASSANLEDPSGSSCGAASGNSSSAGSSAAGGATSVATPATSTLVASLTAAASSATGGVFAPGASSATASTAILTTMLTVTAAPTSAAPVQSSAAPAASTGTGSTSNGTSCSTDGAVVCNGSTQFGLCNHGSVVWQDVAAGTTCTNGVISRRHPAVRMMSHKRNPHAHHL